MKNVKFIVGFSVFGFLLSFCSSFRTVARTFGMRFFIALMFAFSFAVLAFLISFVADKFLNLGEGFVTENVSSAGQTTVSSNSPVDIVIQDEELPEEENDAQFFVGSNHQMLNDEDLKAANTVNTPVQPEKKESAEEKVKAANESMQADGFVPINIAETSQNFTSVESKNINEVKVNKSVTENPETEQKDDNGIENLDVLPNLEDISEGKIPLTSSADNAELVEDSDFAENKNVGSSSASVEEVTNGKDAELMAKAISTLLAKE